MASSKSVDQSKLIERVAFVRPLPFGKRNVTFAIVAPNFAFNAFGTSMLLGEEGQLQVRIQSFSPMELEGIELGMAEAIHVRRIEERLEEEEDAFGWHGQEMDKDEALGEYFSMPRLLSDGDLFAVPVSSRKKLLFLATFPSNSSSSSSSCQEHPKRPKFVQRGQSNCVELSNERAGHPQQQRRFPQCHSGQMRPHLLRQAFLPKTVKDVAKEMASRFWPLFYGVEPFWPPNQLVLLQAGAFEGARLVLEQLAMLLDVRLCQLDCLLELWQEGVGQGEKIAEKMESELSNVDSFCPCICWIRNISVLFPRQGQSNDELFALLAGLSRRVYPASLLRSEPIPRAPTILFIFTCTSTERLEMPLRLGKLVQWQFGLAEGDEKMTEEERECFTRHKMRSSKFACPDWGLVRKVAEKTKGYTLFGLEGLVCDAEKSALSQMDSSMEWPPPIRFEHFQRTMEKRTPKKGTNSRVNLADVGGLDEAKQLLKEALGELVKEADGGEEGGMALLRRRTGILLHGPPGCGKTLLAKAVANEFGLAFQSVKGPELLSQYVGESERNLRELFRKARQNAPAVLFFDELDSLAPNRGKSTDAGGVMDRMVSQLLTELDECQWNRRKPLFVMGATNRPDLLDPCLLTPGRFDNLVPIRPATDFDSKVAILRPLCKNVKLADGLQIGDIVGICPEEMSGAELAGLVRSATMQRIREIIGAIESGKQRGQETQEGEEEDVVLALSHFECALKELESNYRL